ncbi:anthranilate synthase component I [Clostridium luticellarii]|jgi:anthranilate synthase component 1|uniref:Anthranilate synthase component 1 n=1 Tax=Clostridium luticellarii TaxID=1691940 RepID=A0A2T0BF38_9CLOT|nr:anthranilate synthase component I [Clostridium luticellarii]MCI1945332.1 anthranilate synthase component I [Clostridium luticellarii]MCI1968703.1 anthranilate synthase component I [Clostridium luticellarii]MCI2040978.1 anthranilate synthase component I [Clostridium luticellarii]PRR82479.1 Anthranilate synthase component 1 [Clostridium luticellarii]
MLNLSEEEFYRYKSLKKNFSLFIKSSGDETTPISIYYNLDGKNKFLLESIYSENEIGRYSFIGMDPYMKMKSCGSNICVEKKGLFKNIKGKILDYIKKYLNVPYEAPGLSIPFTGGAVGYVGYDVVRQYEKLPDENKDDIETPESYMMFYKKFICYDHFKHEIYLIYNFMEGDSITYQEVELQLEQLKDMVGRGNSFHRLEEKGTEKQVVSNVTEKKYCKMVEKAREYIKSGDIFQVVLSQRLKSKSTSHPFDVYRRLRSENPSPYLFYIDFGEFEIAGSSPESLVSVKNGTVITNPIAGTRPRGRNMEEDIKLKQELLNDGKERAEHVMLVDLGRNDIGKISEFGSVNLDKFMDVGFYSHVMHIVSKVSGRLKKNLGYVDALISCLPVGTVSGAPKIRAMEIIDELENSKRGIYSGAVGYFSFNGNMDTCIAIRTILFKDGYAYVQSGAGIVYDSVAENEYRETLNKARAMIEVI